MGDGGGGGGGNTSGGGGGKNRRSDEAMFGNGWLPNIAIIINQYLIISKHAMPFTKLTWWAGQNSKFKWWGLCTNKPSVLLFL